MNLCIKLNEGKTLRDVALEIQMLNQAMASLLVNGEIPCNPDSEYPEGFLGDVNTPPNEFGYVTLKLTAYRKFIIPPELSPTTFQFVLGDAVEDTANGEVWVGSIT